MLETCVVFFMLIEGIFSSYCGSYIPKNAGTCTQYTNSSHICCFLRGSFQGYYHSMCFPFTREIYYKMGRSVKVNGYTYRLDCGEQRGALCGEVINPIMYKDCSVYSTSSNSCCFYEYRFKTEYEDHEEWDSDTNCLWLGTSAIGVMEYRNLRVICSSQNLKNYILKLIPLLLLVLF